MESQVGTHILSAMSSTKERNIINRRTGNAGLSPEQVDLLLANGKMILPFLQNQGLTTTSDEENGSMASVKIRDSKVNIVLRKKELNMSTDLAESNCGNGLNIMEYQTDSDTEADNKQLARLQQSSHLDPISSGEYRAGRGSGRRDLRGSKSSSKSKSSRRSSRQSGRIKCKRQMKGPKSIKSKEDGIRLSTFKRKHAHLNSDVSHNCKNSLGSSFDSYCSELGPLALQSSFSGVSVEKNNSRSSKRSCDVGIQANPHDIATHTLSSYEGEMTKKSKLSALKKSQNSHLSYNTTDKSSAPDKKDKLSKKKSSVNSDMRIVSLDKRDVDTAKYSHSGSKNRSHHVHNARHDDPHEPLLIQKKTDRPVIITKRNDGACNLSESKKLKQLLLP